MRRIASTPHRTARLWVFFYTYPMFTALRSLLDQKGEVSFSVRVHPGAPRTKAKGALDDGTLKIDIAAVPEEGKANAELIRFLAEEFNVPRSHIEILKGHVARTKAVRVRGRD